MKTQILALEAHDDLVSVRDRMSWAKSKRILLVWPGFEKVALRPLDLRVLQKHAHYLGAELGLVTRRGEVRRDAEGFSIPVFQSTVEAQGAAWPPSTRSSTTRRPESAIRLHELRSIHDEQRVRAGRRASIPLVRIGSFVLGVAAVLALGALFVPRATISLTPMTAEQSLTLQVEADSAQRSVGLVGTLPAHEVTVTVNGTQSERIESQAMIPKDKARGIAHFQNLTESAVVIPSGTVIYADPPSSARFATLNETRLDAKLNAFVEVPIEAVDAGSKGNVPADSIRTIETSLGTFASVTNPAATAGGSERSTAVPSAADRERLRGALLEVLGAEAQRQMSASLGAQDTVLSNTLKAGEIQEEAYDPAAGQPGSLLSLTIRAVFTAQYVKGTDLRQLVEATLDTSMPAGFVAKAESERISIASAPKSDANGASHFDVKVERTLAHDLNLMRVGVLVRGRTPAAAASLLQAELQLGAPAKVSLSPSWWPWLPLIPFRVTVELQ
jgi:hypothetical protein